KGVPAALQMARATSQIRAIAPHCASPSELLTRINSFLCANPIGGIFITMACAFFNRTKKTMRLASAGHYPPLCLRDGAFHPVIAGDGIPLGILDQSGYTDAEMELKSGDLFLFFTDGLLEARDPSRQEFGMERIQQVMAYTAPDPDQLIVKMVSSVDAFMGNAPRHDDLTLVAAKFI